MTLARADRAAPQNRYFSPLRYPGGKSKLTGFVKAVFRANDLLDGTYVEPYAGGASLALSLLFDEYAGRIVINDYDPGVFAFWSSVLTETAALCRLIRNTPVTPAEWKKQRAVYQKGAAAGVLQLGFATFFLNRTNRSGIIASGGMIGGSRQTGTWKIDARYNASELVRRIQRIAEYSDRIRVSNLDALTFLRRTLPRLGKRSLVYLDPPYYVQGQQRLYANYYEPADHERIAEVMPHVQVPWIVSYDDRGQIRRLYEAYRSISYRLHYAASERHHGAEVMFFAHGLSIPATGYP